MRKKTLVFLSMVGHAYLTFNIHEKAVTKCCHTIALLWWFDFGKAFTPLFFRSFFFCHDKSNYDFANYFFVLPNSSLSDFKCLTRPLLILVHSHQSNIVLLILDADPCTVSNCKAIYSDSHQDKIHYLCRRGLHLQTL